MDISPKKSPEIRHLLHKTAKNQTFAKDSRTRTRLNTSFLQKPLHILQYTEDQNHNYAKQTEPGFNLSYGTNHGTDKSEEDNELNHGHGNMERHLTLFDLTSIGVGGTIGSGIFVLCGLIANSFAGPATFISWAIAGVAAMLSGCAYAELAARIPSAGSAYVYVYASMGELPAFIAAGCLTLEYVAASAAVARSWGEKVAEWLVHDVGILENGSNFLTDFIVGKIDVTKLSSSSSPERVFNPLAFAISAVSVTLLLKGVKESKAITNLFTITKVGVVVFMTVGGLVLLKPENLSPLIPPEFGWAGVFRGATSSFFGYLGYDEICCIAGEATNPKKNIPYAILFTLLFSMFIYIMAALGLTGMQPYQEIDGIEGFPGAFSYNNVQWASQITAAGEIITLPIVVLITVMAQPRLQFALAQDGLLPQWFAKLDDTGNLWNGTLSSGVLMILIASFIPFTHLNDMISAGVLVAFSMTSSSLLLLKHESPKLPSVHGGKDTDSFLMEKLVAVFNAASFLVSIILTHFMTTSAAKMSVVFLISILVICCLLMYLLCPKAQRFGGEKRRRKHSHQIGTSHENDVLDYDNESNEEKGYFKTPFMPFLPCAAIFINWYLISQLEVIGIMLLLSFLAFCSLFYYMYGAKHSILRKHYGSNIEMEPVSDHFENDEIYADESFVDDPNFHRSISLPRRGASKI